ncbi:hypothetical protein CCR93_14195 [Rhodobium orientis]|nr:hypothetical protein [Rhodobium orientis]
METFGMSAGWARGIQVVIAFVIVFALLAAFLWIMRRLTRTGFGHGGRTRQPRLAIMDQAHIDTRRRLVLVRRDNVEHLVLVRNAWNSRKSVNATVNPLAHRTVRHILPASWLTGC